MTIEEFKRYFPDTLMTEIEISHQIAIDRKFIHNFIHMLIIKRLTLPIGSEHNGN